jgi:putative ABC transport system permease protein
MKLAVYIWRNVTRNKLRSSLTILSVSFSLALMTLLYSYLAMQNVAQREAEKHDRLTVLNKVGFAGLLPIAYVDRIGRMDGVAAASPLSWFGGNYMNKQALFAQFGVDPQTIFKIFAEYAIPADQIAAFQSDKQGCVADQQLAEQLGWQLGDRIPLEGTIYPCNLDLRLVGIYRAPSNTGSLWFNWHYLDEQLRQTAPDYAGNSGMVYVKCKVSDEVALVSERIDASFANSENATRTRTEAAFQKMFADMLGDVQSYIRYISLAVVFALTLVAATTMAMAMRERTTEIAVLKAIGFSKIRVLSLVIGESTMIAVLGSLLGIAGGLGALQLLSTIPIAAALFPIPVVDLVGLWLLGLLLLGAAIGLVSGIAPAVMAAQRSVVDGLRRVV